MRRALIVVLLSAGVPAAFAAGGPVPAGVQARIEAKAPAVAYVPTRMAIGFHYRSWSYGADVLRIRFRNARGWEIVFVAAPLRGSCVAGKEKSFQLAGNKVYWAHTANEQQAWRCVRAPSGRMVRLVAASPQPPTTFADVGLGAVVASGRYLR
jgi:hypothetical protein